MPEFKTDMDKQITPEIRVNNDKMPSVPVRAIFIEAIHEYFSEVSDEEEQASLLGHLENLLRNTPNLICHFDIPADEEKKSLRLIRKHFGAESALEKQLSWQITTKFWRHKFLDACQQQRIDTVHIGGVYGRACVWDAARSMADDIYSKQLGDAHPNIRFHDTDETYRFKNAVILPEITEGYFDTEDDYEMEKVENSFEDEGLKKESPEHEMSEKEVFYPVLTLSEFVCFPATKYFSTQLIGTDIVSECADLYPGQLGESYKAFSSLDSANIKCDQLFEWMEGLPTTKTVAAQTHNSNLFWASESSKDGGKESKPADLDTDSKSLYGK